jgi:hypothetical protein
MSQRSLTRALLTPSLLSGYATFFVVLIVLGVSAWSYVSQGELLHDYLFGPYGIVTTMLYAPDFFAVFRRTIVNNPLTYDAFILVCALLIGVFVFELFEALRRFSSGTSVVWYEFHANTPQAKEALKETLARTLARCSGAIGLVLYGLFLANILTPFCILMVQNGIDQLSSSFLLAIGTFVLSFLYLALSLHVVVVLIRLSLLRPRLFGGWAVQPD